MAPAPCRLRRLVCNSLVTALMSLHCPKGDDHAVIRLAIIRKLYPLLRWNKKATGPLMDCAFHCPIRPLQNISVTSTIFRRSAPSSTQLTKSPSDVSRLQFTSQYEPPQTIAHQHGRPHGSSGRTPASLRRPSPRCPQTRRSKSITSSFADTY